MGAVDVSRSRGTSLSAHIWLLFVGLTFVALTAVIDVSSVFALGASFACAVIVRTSLSPLARAYVAYIVLGLVVAPRFAVIPHIYIDRTQFLASLWILAACLGAVISSRTDRPAPRVPVAASGQRVTPAVLIAIGSLLAGYLLVSRGSFGVAGQYATGISGGGYLGLLVQIGPPSAAGALLSTLARPTRTSGALVVPAALVALQAVALTYSGFRGAAPFYVLAVALCAFRPAASKRTMPVGRRVVVGAVLFCFMGGLLLNGASVRQNDATAAGYASAGISVSNALPTVVQRFDESTYLARADESRHDPAAREAVSLRNQLAAIVPRFLYPSKGIVDYGHQVSVAVYGAPASTRNSSTVTTFGDALINVGVAGGVILVAIYVFLFDSVFRRMRSAATVRALSVRVALVMAAVNLEAPAVLNLVGILRVSLAIVVAQWLVARVFTPLAGRRHDVADRPRRGGGQRPTARSDITPLAEPADDGAAGRDLTRPSGART